MVCTRPDSFTGVEPARIRHTAPRDGNRRSPKAFITQELLREAIFQVYLSLGRLRNNKRFASWLYGISLNVCRNSLRSQKREVSSLEAMVGGMFIDPAMLSEGVGDPLAIAEEHEVTQAILRSV